MADDGDNASPLRICLYTTTALPLGGGQELAVDALARELSAMKHDVVVLAPRLAHRGFDRSLPYPVVRHPRFISTRRFVPWYARYLRSLHRRKSIDILHCHEAYPAGYLGAIFARESHVPLVITMHDGPLVTASNADAPSIICRRRAEAIAEASALIALSGLMRDFYERHSPRARIVDIPNGVHADLLAAPVTRPGSLPADFEEPFVLFIGRLNQQKGPDLLIRAFAALGAEIATRLVIAGVGPAEAELRRLATSLPINDRVHFTGWVADEAKRFLLQRARCVVVPSRTAESFGIVALESAAAGRPVIAADINGLREQVRHGETGLLFAPDSVDDLTGALRMMLREGSRADAMGEAARRWAQPYNWSAIAQRHVALYRAVIDEATHRSAV